MSESARTNRDEGWTPPEGPVSRKIFRQAMILKEAAGRIVDHPYTVDELREVANTLIHEADRIASMEQALVVEAVAETDPLYRMGRAVATGTTH